MITTVRTGSLRSPPNPTTASGNTVAHEFKFPCASDITLVLPLLYGTSGLIFRFRFRCANCSGLAFEIFGPSESPSSNTSKKTTLFVLDPPTPHWHRSPFHDHNAVLREEVLQVGAHKTVFFLNQEALVVEQIREEEAVLYVVPRYWFSFIRGRVVDKPEEDSMPALLPWWQSRT